MNPGDLQKIKNAFNDWANTHDAPNVPASIRGTRALTPRQVADEVINETPEGKSSIDFIESTMQRTHQSIDEICEWINPKGRKYGR